MRLATVDQLANFMGITQKAPDFVMQATAYLDSASTVLARRLGTSFTLSGRYSLFSLSESDLRNVGDTLQFRLGCSLITKDPVTVRLASTGQTLFDNTGGTEYLGVKVVDRKKGIVTIPKQAFTVFGDFKISIQYTSGLPESTDTEGLYADVPDELTHAALATAAGLFYTKGKAQVGSKYNKYDPRVAEQSMQDCYSIYDRPRALVIFEELDEVISP